MTADTKSLNRSWFIGFLSLFVLAHTMHHIVSSMLTPLLPFIRDDFTLTYTQIGILAMAYNLAYGFSQLPAGWLADRVGARVTLTIGVVGVAIAGLLVGLSPGYLLLAVFLVLMGLAGGGYHPSASPLVSAAMTPETRGRALGIHQVGGSISFFVAPLIAAALAVALGWRGTFLAISIPTILFGIIFFVLLGRLGYAAKPKAKVSAQDEKMPQSSGHLSRLVAVLGLGIASMVLLFSAMSFIPLYIADNFGVSRERAAALFALCVSGGLWAGPLGGYVSDRIGKVPVIVAAGIIGAPAIFLMSVAPFGLAFYVVLVLVGMSQHISMPVVEAYVISHVSPKRRSTVLGIYYTGSRGGPGLITPAIGLLIDTYGFKHSFSVVAATTLVVTVAFTLLWWANREKRATR